MLNEIAGAKSIALPCCDGISCVDGHPALDEANDGVMTVENKAKKAKDILRKSKSPLKKTTLLLTFNTKQNLPQTTKLTN